jgi:sarcosine oxidase
VTRAADVAVVGAGILGLSTADALVRRGASVVCIDGGLPGNGQSAGGSRGFRHLHEDPALTRLSLESRDAWRRLEARAGAHLLERGGSLRLGAAVEPAIAALTQAGIEARVLDAGEAAARMPFLAAEAGPLLFEKGGGALRAREAFRALTGFVGDALLRARVHEITPSRGTGVRLTTAAGPVECERCVVCAGAGTERLVAPLGIEIERERRAALRLTFRVTDEAAAGPFPVWADGSGRYGELVYGAPDGPGRYALGLFETTEPLDAPFAEAVPGGVDVRDARRRLVAYARAAFPGLHPSPVDAVFRLTTALSGLGDDAFGLWERDGVLAFAGWNLFKHAPRIGELLADVALGDAAHPVLTAAIAGRGVAGR